ncbi:MAG: tryptophan--tRNA ligase [Turicibacter sp.]|nr:tryptophan--tRNA ligase [Turicibacter sp.]
MARILSGIQPSGVLTLGNYIGALKNFVKLQNEHECLFMVVDLHAITVPQDRLALRKNIKELAALYVACGIDPQKSILFVQSEVPAHAELSWILTCNASMGELSRMTQFKDKSAKQESVGGHISAGLFSYPVLMAADVILYDVDMVPVGDDQKQHMELTRDLAERFNARFGETFKVPEVYIPEQGARIMSLQEPEKKMSKSDDNSKNIILLTDPPNTIRKKIKSAITDSETTIAYDPVNRKGISNLLEIYAVITGEPIDALVTKYEGKGYGDFKSDLAEVVVAEIEPIQQRQQEILASGEIDDILDAGRDAAMKMAVRKISKVKHKVGLGRKR